MNELGPDGRGLAPDSRQAPPNTETAKEASTHMTPRTPIDLTRRAFLRRLGLMLPASAAVAAIGSRAFELLLPNAAGAAAQELTPSCGDTVTQRQTEGPYFKPSSPERQSLL